MLPPCDLWGSEADPLPERQRRAGFAPESRPSSRRDACFRTSSRSRSRPLSSSSWIRLERCWEPHGRTLLASPPLGNCQGRRICLPMPGLNGIAAPHCQPRMTISSLPAKFHRKPTRA